MTSKNIIAQQINMYITDNVAVVVDVVAASAAILDVLAAMATIL